MQRLARLKVELQMLQTNPPPGIHCWQDDNIQDMIHAEISRPEGTPYENGQFRLEITLGERYPFAPPNVRFITPIYHPNIDPQGRICLEPLKPKPSGSWSVKLNIPTLLSAIRVLLAEPNLGDPLMTEIAKQYSEDIEAYRERAKEETMRHAIKQKHGSQLSQQTSSLVSDVESKEKDDNKEDHVSPPSPKKLKLSNSP